MAGVMMASRAGLAAARPAPTASRASTSSSTAAAAPSSSTLLRSFGGDNARFASVVARASAAEIVDAASDEADGVVPAGGRRGGRGGGRGGGRSGGRGRGDGGGRGRRDGASAEAPEFQERVVQVSRVTKVCTGGKQLSFRAVVVVGDEKGQVGVGTATSKEVVDAVQKAVIAAKKEMVTVPLTRGATFPHRVDGVFGAARVMLRPASEGTGVIAGGAVRVVLELAGVKNAFGKQLGSGNPLNNARAAVEGLRLQRTVEMVAKERGLTVAQMLQHKPA